MAAPNDLPQVPRPRALSLVAAAALSLALFTSPVAAQDLPLAIDGTTLTGQSLILIAAVTVLSLAPGLAVMVTCFPFIVTVLSILRQAIGLQQAPPNMLIVSLALFLTWFIMEPVFLEAWSTGISPLLDGSLGIEAAFAAVAAPFRVFMTARMDLETFTALAELRPGLSSMTDPAVAPLSVVVPSFLLSEVSRAFEIGFLVFLPFLIIDLVVSAILMSMGMMMVPPAIVALPFKLAFFVLADGWTLISGALVRSYF